MVQSQVEGRKQMRDYPLPDHGLYLDKELHAHSGFADEYEQEIPEAVDEPAADNLSRRLEQWLGLMNR